MNFNHQYSIMRHLFFSLAGGLWLTLSSFSGPPVVGAGEAPIPEPEDWTLYEDHDQLASLRIEYRFTDCTEQGGYSIRYVQLRVTNQTGETLDVDWDRELYFNEECVGCGSSENESHFTLEPQETIEGEC